MLVYLGLQLRQVRVKHYASKRTKFIMAHDLRIACFTLAQDDQFTTNTKETLVQIFNTSDGTLLQEVIAEALGTFMLVFSIYGIISSSQIMGRGQVGLLEYAITASLAVIVVVFSIGGISGAHVNPAVTIAFATAGPFPWSKVPLYILAQIVGSIVATYVGKLVYGIKSKLMTTRPVQGWASTFFVELILTFIILFVTCSLINEAQTAHRLDLL